MWRLNVHSVGDCIELGRVMYNKGDYYHTVMWMEQALQQLQHEKPSITEDYYNRTHALILDYLAFATYQACRPIYLLLSGYSIGRIWIQIR